MKRKFISGLEAGDTVDDVFCVQSQRVQNFKNKPGEYLSLTLSDKSGSIDAKLWNYEPGIHDIPTGTVIKCTGEVCEFADSLEIHIHSYEPVDKTAVSPADFLPLTPHNIETMQKEMAAIVVSFSNPYLKQLLGSLMQDKELFQRFSPLRQPRSFTKPISAACWNTA